MYNKMHEMFSLSTSTVANKFCMSMRKNKKTVCSACYAYRIERRVSVVQKKYERNSRILSGGLLERAPYIDTDIFRFNSLGELLNDMHLINLFKICNSNLHCTFALWTKRVDIVHRHIQNKPSNLILIFSSPFKNLISELPKGFDKTFTVFSAKYVRENDISINCKGYCRQCRKCYEFNEHTEIREALR